LVVSVCVVYVRVCVCVFVFLWTTSIIRYVVGPSGWDVGTELFIKLTYGKCDGINTVFQN